MRVNKCALVSIESYESPEPWRATGSLRTEGRDIDLSRQPGLQQRQRDHQKGEATIRPTEPFAALAPAPASTDVRCSSTSEIVEVLPAYSNRGRHYETRFDKILATTTNLAAPRRSRKLTAKYSAKIVHRLTAADQSDIAARYQQGRSSRQLAETYGISKTSIIIVLREAGVPIRRQGLGDFQTGDITERYRAGASLAAIGKVHGVSADTVRKLLLKQRITLRNPWDHP
ncbi:hypothetical protein FHU41_001372 [Psychromicrobium silvestre]|uniref:Helix-turn-helix domain-containing protein n=1 Tax=Psychromicrobium silvestre TaxID=1645614 RepID=A0A7Y9S7K4_9MICC|nr:hypothetical protein [Psychromicrobium silvestre]NYE95151.1 hypothetical protein [Psychromicrobium silvestre]